MLMKLKDLKEKFDMGVRGVIHVGGHIGEEAAVYNELGLKECVFFEPSRKTFEVCRKNVQKFGYDCHNYALGPRSQESEMYVASNCQSSSLLKPKLHLKQYRRIKFRETEVVNVVTLDEFMKRYSGCDFNFINMDVQGYELQVLMGAIKTIDFIDYIYCEVNRAELYEGCAMVEHIDDFLNGFDFSRVATNWRGRTWGDALYIRS
jgi:FkbM family methyltransferase